MGAREIMAQWSRALAALAEDLGSLPAPRQKLTSTYNSSSRVSKPDTYTSYQELTKVRAQTHTHK